MASVVRLDEMVQITVTAQEFTMLQDGLDRGADWIDHCENETSAIRIQTPRAAAMRNLVETIRAADAKDRSYH